MWPWDSNLAIEGWFLDSESQICISTRKNSPKSVHQAFSASKPDISCSLPSTPRLLTQQTQHPHTLIMLLEAILTLTPFYFPSKLSAKSTPFPKYHGLFAFSIPFLVYWWRPRRALYPLMLLVLLISHSVTQMVFSCYPDEKYDLVLAYSRRKCINDKWLSLLRFL